MQSALLPGRGTGVGPRLLDYHLVAAALMTAETIDTSSAAGELVFHIFGALARFERRLIKEHTREGVAAAKKRGSKLGRRASLTPSQATHARELIEAGKSQREVARCGAL